MQGFTEMAVVVLAFKGGSKERLLIKPRQSGSTAQCHATHFTLHMMIFWWVCSSVTVQTTSNYSFSSVTFSLIYTVSIFLFIKMAERMSDCVNNGDTPSFLAKRQPQNHKKWTIKWVINLSFIVKWNFLKIVRLNIIFMVQLKSIPAVNQYSEQNDILSALLHWQHQIVSVFLICKWSLYSEREGEI